MRPNILMPIMIFMTRFYNIPRHILRINSDSKHLNRISRLALVILIAVFASSCEKGLLKVGGDILPESDFVTIRATDSLSVFSYTMFNDSARTDLPSLSYLGQLYDPAFGTSNAGFVSQLRLNTRWDGQPFTVDSMKLFLHLLTTSGTSDEVHSIRISEIGNQIYPDTAYYSNTALDTTGFNVADIVLPALRTDTINDVELNLPGKGVAFGNYLTRDTSKLFYNNKIADFRSYFKGLYFRLNSGSKPFLVSLSLVYNSQLATYFNYFVLFVHDSTGTSKQYSLILDAKNINASFNVFSHDFNTAIGGDKFPNRNTTYKDTLSYLQAFNGVYTKISLPGLEQIKNDPAFSKIAINRARLVVPVSFNATTSIPYISKVLPASLRLRYRSKTGLRYDVPDYLMSASVDQYHLFFDGSLDTTKMVYNFNIPAFVQAYLRDATGGVKPEVEIYQGTGTKNAVFRVNKNKTPVKFEFTYTQF